MIKIKIEKEIGNLIMGGVLIITLLFIVSQFLSPPINTTHDEFIDRCGNTGGAFVFPHWTNDTTESNEYSACICITEGTAIINGKETNRLVSHQYTYRDIKHTIWNGC